MQPELKAQLAEHARQIRLGVLTEVYSASSGHPGGSLSIAEILSFLYFKEMRVSPETRQDDDRDRFVLSKGHCAPGLYAALAERGYFSKDLLPGFRSSGSILQGHAEMKGVPGVDMSTGSLGQGISAACGMAASAKIFGRPYNVYAVMGDGELEEGQCWEAAMFAAHYKLDNLCAFIDFNGLQIDGEIVKVMNPTPIDKKYEAFGWNVVCVDGHDFDQLEDAAAGFHMTKGKPTAIICKTTKGKGVSFMENQAGWHGKAPNKEQYEQAMAELGAPVAAK